MLFSFPEKLWTVVNERVSPTKTLGSVLSQAADKLTIHLHVHLLWSKHKVATSLLGDWASNSISRYPIFDYYYTLHFTLPQTNYNFCFGFSFLFSSACVLCFWSPAHLCRWVERTFSSTTQWHKWWTVSRASITTTIFTNQPYTLRWASVVTLWTTRGRHGSPNCPTNPHLTPTFRA